MALYFASSSRTRVISSGERIKFSLAISSLMLPKISLLFSRSSPWDSSRFSSPSARFTSPRFGLLEETCMSYARSTSDRLNGLVRTTSYRLLVFWSIPFSAITLCSSASSNSLRTRAL
ncbi:hypothetical protein D3C87_1624510 [compost metagenome]